MCWLGVLDAELLQRVARGHDVAAGAVGDDVEVELAELHDHDPVVGQVLERLLDHLRRVEVALRQHERARRRRVGRRVAVGRDVPDEVVVVVAAREVGAAVAGVRSTSGRSGEVAGVVGEVVGEQRHGHRVQLDRFDVGRAEVQRREDLVAARRADDQLVPGGPPRTSNGIARGSVS